MHARIRAGAPGAFQALYVRDAPSTSAAGSARLTSSGFTVDGTLKAGNIATGLNLKGAAFRAVATTSTNVPGTAVTGVGVTNVTAYRPDHLADPDQHQQYRRRWIEARPTFGSRSAVGAPLDITAVGRSGSGCTSARFCPPRR